MKKKIHYKDNPFGEVKLGKRVWLKNIPNLPRPETLAKSEKTHKITLSISQESLDFFKNQADKYDIPYQVMIRRLLDEYRTQS